MSRHWLRHFVIALVYLIWGVVPLLAVIPVQATSQTNQAPASVKPESAVLRKFRDSGPPVMRQASEFEATAVPQNSAPEPNVRSVVLAPPNNSRLFGEVFGFAFASSLGDNTIGYPSWNFARLSTVAYFGVHVTWTGDFSDDSALSTWNNPYGPVPGFINTAHAYGTKVVLTLIMFDSLPGTPNMCSALQRRAVTIQNTVNQVLAKGIDGVNVDYESNNSSCTDGNGVVQSSQSLFTAFLRELRAALPSGSYISVDTYSGSAGYRDCSTCPFLGFYDIGALANYADSFFVMAYDMEYANWDSPPLSCASFCIGPTSPLSTYLFNQGRASSEYRAVVPGSKVIMGMPYYGRKGCVRGYTPSNAPANVGVDTVGADGYLDASTEEGYYANTDYHRHRETRDPLSATRWDTFTSSTAGCTREMYWDDVTALSNKYDRVIQDRLRGIGIFALNYGGGAPELWDLINLKFGQCSQGAIAADKMSPQIPGTAITFTGSALCAGTAQYRFWISPPGSLGWSILQDYGPAAAATWDTTGKALGTYRFEVDARNLGSAVSYDTVAYMTMRLALCVTPTIIASPASPQLPGTAINITASVTCKGTPEYQFSMQPPGGALSVVQPYGSNATFAWNTTQSGYGDYNFSVSVRTVGTAVAAESAQTMTYSLTSCITPVLTTNKASPQPTGTQVILSGNASCAGMPQYRFMIKPPAGSWAVAQDFGSSNTFTWNGAGPGGTYLLELDAKGGAAAASTMASTQVSFDLASCSAVTLAGSPASPQVPGTAVVITGSATCPGTAQYRFWFKNPGAAYTMVRDYGSASTYSWNTTGLSLGDYGFKVDVKNLGATTAAEASASIVDTLANAACTTPTLTSDIASPQGAGTVITFSATTTTCPNPLFRFHVQNPGDGWTQMQDWSALRTFQWKPMGVGGNYHIEVDVRDATRPVPYDQYTTVAFVINACSGVTLSPSVSSPQPSGTQVVLTASASASFCPNPQYQFWTQPLGSNSTPWTIARAYSGSATFTWNTTGLAAGTYRYTVWVRDASSSGAACSALGCWDAYFPATNYTLTSVPCTSVTESAAPPSTATAGTSVTFTANASGCPNPRYQFWTLAPGSTMWTIAQPYSPSATFSWNISGLAVGSYRYTVWVRDASSAGTGSNNLGTFDAYSPAAAYTLTLAACAAVTESAAPPSTAATGTTVTFTASASGCTNPLYQFWLLAPGSSTWTIAQPYSTTATFAWNTTGLAGTHRYTVWARDAGSAGTSSNNLGTFDAYAPATNYTLTAAGCSVIESAAPPSTAASGTTVTFTASGSGCPNPRYQFWILAPGSTTWMIGQSYSAMSTFAWNTTGLVAGSYTYTVWVRDAGSAGTSSNNLGTFDAYAPATAYTLTVTPCTSVSETAAPPTTAASGATVTFTAVASGCPNARYQFWILAPGSTTWTIGQAYSPSATFAWNTTGSPAGVYKYTVWARDASSTGTGSNNLGTFDTYFPATNYTLS